MKWRRNEIMTVCATALLVLPAVGCGWDWDDDYHHHGCRYDCPINPPIDQNRGDISLNDALVGKGRLTENSPLLSFEIVRGELSVTLPDRSSVETSFENGNTRVTISGAQAEAILENVELSEEPRRPSIEFHLRVGQKALLEIEVLDESLEGKEAKILRRVIELKRASDGK
jgi:hypothetical protein